MHAAILRTLPRCLRRRFPGRAIAHANTAEWYQGQIVTGPDTTNFLFNGFDGEVKSSRSAANNQKATPVKFDRYGFFFEGSLNGQVKSETGVPLPGASLVLTGVTLPTLGSDGKPTGSYKVGGTGTATVEVDSAKITGKDSEHIQCTIAFSCVLAPAAQGAAPAAKPA